MKARVVRLRDINSRDEQLWRDLSCRAAEPNPFMEPDCLIPAALHLRFGGEIEIVLAEEDDRVYACIPVRAMRKYHFPYPFVTTEVRRTLECGTPLVDAERGAEGMAAILSALSKRRRITRSRALDLPQVSQDGPVFEACRAAAQMANLPFIVHESFDRGLLRRRPEPGYERLFSAGLRHSLRRLRRRLAEQLGTEPGLVDQTADPDAVDRFLRLEGSQGYKVGTHGIAMTTEAGESEFFADMCHRFAAAGRLHLLALVAGGQTVAMEVWLQGGGGLFRFKMAYDERYARYGPGLQMQVVAMEHFHKATDADWIDTCTARGNEMALRLYPDRRRTAGIFVLLSRNPLDSAAVHSFMAVRPVHKWIYDKRHPTPSRSHPRQRPNAA